MNDGNLLGVCVGVAISTALGLALLVPSNQKESSNSENREYWQPIEMTNSMRYLLADLDRDGKVDIINDYTNNIFIAKHLKGTKWDSPVSRVMDEDLRAAASRAAYGVQNFDKQLRAARRR